MIYMRVSDGEYPLYEGDVRLEHHEIDESATGDDFPCPPTFVKVEATDPPQYDMRTQYLTYAQPVREGQKWVMTWTVRSLSQETIRHRAEANDKRRELAGLPSNNNSGSAPDVI